MAFSMAAMRTALPSAPCSRPFAPAAQQSQCVRLSSFTGLAQGNRLALRTAAPAQEAATPMSRASTVQVFAMRHGKRVPRLGRPADQRKALLRSLTTEILRHGRITTTVTRAKAVRKYVDKMITLAKDGSLHARRQAMAFVYDPEIVKALFDEAPKRYNEREGGYCRVKREVQPRRGDNAPMAVVELV